MNPTAVHKPLLSGKKILLVEDDPFLGKILYSRLQSNEAKATLVAEGDKALSEVMNNIPDAVLLDIQLPVMDGFQILDAMRKNKNTKDVPVIIISNFNQVKDKDHATELGADFLVKALVTPDDIMKHVKDVLDAKGE